MEKWHGWALAAALAAHFALGAACSGSGATDAGTDVDAGIDGADGADAGDADRCRGKTCDTPPVDECEDATFLRTYLAPGRCDPADGSCAYSFSRVECPSGCREGRCQDIGEGRVQITVPDATRICTSYAHRGDSVSESWQVKVRLSLRPGRYLLSYQDDESALDWVERFEAATDGAAAVPSGPGRITREWRAQPGQGDFELVFRQRFAKGAEPIDLELRFLFSLSDGQPVQPILVLDPATLTRGSRFSGSTQWEWRWGELMSCDTSALEERTRDFAVQNGDNLRLRSRGWIEPFGFPDSFPCFMGGLEEARYTHGGNLRIIDGYFDLAQAINHHGGPYSYWIHLDPPQGEITDLFIDEFSFGQQLLYMGAGGAILDQQQMSEVPHP
jgi:hypothetical protein